MPTRISIPDGGSIAISGPCLLDSRFWTIGPARIALTREIKVLGLRRIEVFPGVGRFQWDTTFGEHERRLAYGWCSDSRPNAAGYPPLTIDVETGLGTIHVQASEDTLSLSLVDQRFPDAGFDQWERQTGEGRSRERYQALFYGNKAVLIDRVIVNDVLVFERTKRKCRVDVWFDTAERNPYKCSGSAIGTKQATARPAAKTKRPAVVKNR